jgi:hypothetical protein
MRQLITDGDLMAQYLDRTTGHADNEAESDISLPGGETIGLEFELTECDPISLKEFRLLMSFVVAATMAFGCIVNGWLL